MYLRPVSWVTPVIAAGGSLVGVMIGSYGTSKLQRNLATDAQVERERNLRRESEVRRAVFEREYLLEARNALQELVRTCSDFRQRISHILPTYVSDPREAAEPLRQAALAVRRAADSVLAAAPLTFDDQIAPALDEIAATCMQSVQIGTEPRPDTEAAWRGIWRDSVDVPYDECNRIVVMIGKRIRKTYDEERQAIVISRPN